MQKTQYITDNDAVDGKINTGLIDIVGKGDIKRNTNILLMINAPNSEIIIPKLNLESAYKGLELRAAKKIDFGEVTISEMWNDSMSCGASNVTMDSFFSVTTLKKIYSNSNHPDHLQMYDSTTGRVENILIKKYQTYTGKAFGKQGNIHLTENHHYNNISIGTESLTIELEDPDSNEYPYWFSATNVNNLTLGGNNVNIDPSLNIRIKDVKRFGVVSKTNNKLVGISPNTVERSSDFMYDLYANLEDATNDKKGPIPELDFFEMARRSGLT